MRSQLHCQRDFSVGIGLLSVWVGYDIHRLDVGATIVYEGDTEDSGGERDIAAHLNLVVPYVGIRLSWWAEEEDAEDECDTSPCTCTIACIPQGITEDQHCRLSSE